MYPTFKLTIKKMSTQFYIRFIMKTETEAETFAKFYIGNSRVRSKAIFSSLKGNANVSDTDVLQLEFMEMREGIPVNLDVISCTLQELGENCKLITKELFKSALLE